MTGEVHPLSQPVAPSLAAAILGAVADLLPDGAEVIPRLRAAAGPGLAPPVQFMAAVSRPGDDDAVAIRGAQRLALTLEDIAALVLAETVERHPLMPGALRAAQGDAFGPWPSLGLLVRMLDALGLEREAGGLPAARALDLGLLTLRGERAPLSEQCFALSDPLRHARGLMPGDPTLPRVLPATPMPPGWAEAARALAARVGAQPVCLILRQGDLSDRRGYGALVARALGAEPVTLPRTERAGLGAALAFAGRMPVEEVTTLSGQRAPLMALPGYGGPRIVLADSEGGVATEGADAIDCAPPALDATDRAPLWSLALGGPAPAGLARHRFGPARIAAIGARARAEDGPLAGRVRAAMGAELRPDLEPHARLIAADIDDAMLAASGDLRADLDLLLARCAVRGLGDANPHRMPGVRALLSGPSGTGKTFACGWLATRLGLPLFKLDLASVVSKYIGETEENLARLLDRAEAADVVLLIDEADSLFGARTEAKDSSDRFANNQTNYLLTRIETFDGIVLLTTNGRDRFDSAFARRLDQIIEVAIPGAKERRAIWRICLGPGHDLTPAEVNRLAALIDLAGGHIRNIVRTGEVLALNAARRVALADIRVGIDQEYRKIGRTPPGGLWQ